MSFHEISVAVRAENRASYVFRSISMDVLHLGYSFGLLDSQVGRMVSGILSVVRLFTTLRGILAVTTAAQTAHNIAVGSGAVVQTTLAGTIVGATAAQNARNAAVGSGSVLQTTWTGSVLASIAAQNAQNVATATHIGLITSAIAALGAKIIALFGFSAATAAATGTVMGFNVSLAFTVGLATLGVGVLLALASAMAILAIQANAVASASRSASSGIDTFSRGVTRAGESTESALLRRGVGD